MNRLGSRGAREERGAGLPLSVATALYDLLLPVAGLLGLPWLLAVLTRAPRGTLGLAERLGGTPRSNRPTVWIHAASLGEVRAIGPLCGLIRAGLPAGFGLLLSTMTATGRECAAREVPDVDALCYLPADLPFVTGRALDRSRAALLVLAETELWPHLLAAAFRRSIPVVVVNGRISERSFGRYRALRRFFAPYLRTVRLFLMQSDEDARRVMVLGARPERVAVTGNIKFDRPTRPTVLPEAFARWRSGKMLLTAGSTHQGEEEILLDLIAKPAPGCGELLLALAPRHPERFGAVAELMTRLGIAFARLSDVAAGGEIVGRVVLVDAMGMLEGFYALADVTFVGGSLVPVGGHNLLEPAMLGKPVLSGSHLRNFQDIAQLLTTAGGARIVADGGELAAALAGLCADPEARERMGRAARECVGSSRGATKRNATAILEILRAVTGERVDPR